MWSSARRSVVTSSQAQTPAPAYIEEQDTMSMSPVPATGPARSIMPLSSGMLRITDELGDAVPGSTLSRTPLAIRGELKRPGPLPPRSRQARRKHSKRLWTLGMLVLFMTSLLTLLVSTPQGQELTAKFNPSQVTNNSSLVTRTSNNAPSVSALATATYMYQNDGYDPYSHGQVNVSDGKDSLPWPYGQCTYWSNYRYHQLTGFWVQWTGNADQWFLGAQKAGWDYGQKPPADVPSILVLMPYVQGAGWLGHVAVVESIDGNVVHTSNMNWGYGGSTHVEYVDFTLGPGVYFVWHPPANSN